MTRVLRFVFVSIFFLFIFSVSPVKADSISAPTILAADKLISDFTTRPTIQGLTLAGTEVDIYIDDIYQGGARVNNTDTDTDNFFFQPSFDLGEGVHTVTAVAWAKDFSSNSKHSQEYVFFIEALPAPTLLIPNEEDVVSKLKPRILGLSKSATLIHFYIDGVYNGKTEIIRHESGTANFAYKPFLNLSRTEHVVWAVAEDASGRKSSISNTLNFIVEDPAVSPTLLTPVVNINSSEDQPFIVGLIKNDYKLQVFIDHKLNGEIYPEAHISGITNFAYKPFLSLSPGRHLIYTIGIDARGKESLWSNFIYYTVPDPRILDEAAEEVAVKSIQYTETKQREDSEKDKEMFDSIAKTQNNVSTSSLRDNEKKEKIDIESIIGSDEGDETDITGGINENKEKQNNLKTNIVVFSFFLIAVVAWIFWVNKEIIKEKQKEIEENKMKK
jgi:hypothetical protein